ncbi:MAG TPA: CsgG/HfaB family protein [Myxococcales bacterium]|jgi:curli biogenesis system outer membrane secretion channel CsgG|nr:CsgG/HfaB family protein [Myxococcales bacterium]
MTPFLRGVRALGASSIALLCACGTVPVRVPVVRPAEINMAPYQSIAIAEMRGRGNTVMGDTLEEALLATNRFQVLDRQHMSSVLRELSLSSSDLADPRQAARLGKVMTAAALVYGDVDTTYRETPWDERLTAKDGTFTVLHKLRGEVHIRATFKVVDVATGRLVVAKTYEEDREDVNTGWAGPPMPIDRDALERSGRQEIVARFVRAIVPHQEYVTASFQKDSDIPQLDGGIGWAERGDWKKAQSTFSQAIAECQRNPNIKTGQLAKAYWNLGLSYEYAGDYDSATNTVQKAYELSNDRDMLRELDNIRRLQDEARRVSEQNATPGVGGAY